MGQSESTDDSAERVGWLSHAIEEKDLKPGDHIYCYRIVYSHHGIYTGKLGHEVIHFACPQHKTSLHNLVPWLGSPDEAWPGQGVGPWAGPGSPFEKPKPGQQVDSRMFVRITSCSLEQFLNGGQLRLVAYGESFLTKTLTPAKHSGHVVKSDEPGVVIGRAEYYLQNPEEWKEYNLLSNNCETFACYCKTGWSNLHAQGIGAGLLLKKAL